jgi:hypothetical protein
VRKVVLHLPAWQRVGRQAVTSQAGRQATSAQAGRQQLYVQASDGDDGDDGGDGGDGGDYCSSVISCRPPSTGYGCLYRLLALLQVTGVAPSTSYSCGSASTASESWINFVCMSGVGFAIALCTGTLA